MNFYNLSAVVFYADGSNYEAIQAKLHEHLHALPSFTDKQRLITEFKKELVEFTLTMHLSSSNIISTRY